MNESLRWHKMKKRDFAAAQALLRENEQYYVGACGRFLSLDRPKDSVWILRSFFNGVSRAENKNISGLIVYSRSSLLPVFLGRKEIPSPGFLDSFFGSLLNKVELLNRVEPHIHSVQGLREEALIMETILENAGRKTQESIDYDLMVIDKAPDAIHCSSGPAGLKLRIPGLSDLDALAALQAGYEKEEVLPRGAQFNPAASRNNLARIIGESRILAAELDGRLIGKINVNAVSFTRFQVGGVYVHPDFRGQGIARRMAAEFIGSLIAGGRGVTLFVKKSNTVARSLYNLLGFAVKGDYRISYY